MIKKTAKSLATLADVEREVLAQYRELGRRQLELKRRTRVARMFPNEAALLAVISDDWEAGKIYLNMKN